MPLDLPPEQTGAAAWYGPDLAGRGDWIMPLEVGDLAEIAAASAALAGSDTDIAAITARDFPLPNLGPKLTARVRDEVLNGRGFLLVRGLPVDRWSNRQAAVAFFGLGAHIGSARSQNAQGHVLGHWTSSFWSA